MLQILAGLLIFAVPSFSAVVSDDSGLAGGDPDPVSALQREARPVDGVQVFSARRMASADRPQTQEGLSGTIFLPDDRGNMRPGPGVEVVLRGASGVLAKTETDSEGNWALAQGPADAKVRVRLQNAYWSIQDAKTGVPYEWEAATGAFQLDPASANGSIGNIHLQYSDALEFLRGAGTGDGWMRRALAVRYPGDSNYFTGSQIVLTRAKAWDVNLHEFGHAVMAAGTNSYGGGGYHQISKCYSQGLAWSEGFATFFAGAVRLDAGAEDARFVYLAGGIPLENVPDSVCKGDTNEWRVAAALWDVYDSHPEALDKVSLAFRRVWDPIRGKTMGGFRDAWSFLRPSFQAEELAGVQGALEQNSLPERAAKLARPPLLETAVRPRWD